jgi:hypothetical protein
MEILSAPNIARGMEEDAKENCTEDICLLLENIQFNLSGAVDGESIIEFADGVIKSRLLIHPSAFFITKTSLI